MDYINWRKAPIRRLQSERNKFLQSKPPLEVLLQRLPSLEQQVASLQQELSNILALKVNVRWQESGETLVKYLKNFYRQRTIEQHIITLRPDDTTDPIECIEQMLPIAQQFYQSLYTTDPVDNHHIRSHLDEIHNSPHLTTADNDILLALITIDEIIQETARVENKVSSPGEAGLGYAFLYQLFRYPPLQDLILKVYNQALRSRRFPASWQELRVRLLAKKGNLANLKSWRPISLVNCDAKIYMHILNSRMRQVVPLLINRCHTGFMPNRFIAENGLVLQIVMEYARRCKRDDIALLLDQEKACDRVHPSYLHSVMIHFGFSSVLVGNLCGLFFGNRVRININGHFTNVVHQSRGLRQGNPLSMLLFNMALEPLLRHIIQDTSLTESFNKQ